MDLIALFLPLISFILIFLFGRFFGTSGSILISVLNLFISLVLSVLLFYNLILNSEVHFYSFVKWFDSDLLAFNWSFIFDQLSIYVFCCYFCIIFSTFIFNRIYER